MWSLSGEQGNEWRQAEVAIVSSEPYQFVFEAVRGKDLRGDIAIDGIMITTADGDTGNNHTEFCLLNSLTTQLLASGAY